MAWHVHRRRKGTESIARNSVRLGIRLQSGCHLLSSLGVYGWRQPVGLRAGVESREPGTVKVLIVQENQTSKAQAVHSVISTCFCEHGGNFRV